MTADSFSVKQFSSELHIQVKMTHLNLKLELTTAYVIRHYIPSVFVEKNAEGNYVSATLRSFSLTPQPSKHSQWNIQSQKWKMRTVTASRVTEVSER